MEKNFKSGSRLERVLRSGRFAVTAELNPHDSADPEDVYRAALVLSSVCDGINAVDASGAHCHMSSVSMCALLTRAGYDPVYQVSCGDRRAIPKSSVPTCNTIRRTLANTLSEDELQRSFQEFLHQNNGGQQSILVVIEGKTLHGTIPKEKSQGVHLLAAYLPEEGIVLSQTIMLPTHTSQHISAGAESTLPD